jgi:hypothetical protein
MATTDSLYEPTGVLAMDILGAAFSHAIKTGRTVSKFILRKKLYGHLMEYVAIELEKSGAQYKGEELYFNGTPVEYSILQTEPLIVEYEDTKPATEYETQDLKHKMLNN